MCRDVENDVKVSRRAAVIAWFAFARNAESRVRIDSRRNS
jgi:hypothetical protein